MNYRIFEDYNFQNLLDSVNFFIIIKFYLFGRIYYTFYGIMRGL